MKRMFMLSVLVSGLMLGTVSTAEATHSDTLGAEIVSVVQVVQAFPNDPVLPPSPISPIISLGSYVSYHASTCNAGRYILACNPLPPIGTE